jgi:hypothetical protein
MSNHQAADFIAAVKQSLPDGGFVKLSLGNYKGAEPDLKKVQVRKILVKGQEKLSFTYHYKTRDIVKNFDPTEGVEKIAAALTGGFHAATLFTTAFDLRLAEGNLRKSPPSNTEAATLDHDRVKKRLVETAGKEYLRELKITDAAGSVLKSAQDKYRQIDKYIEILDTLLKDIPPARLKKIVDMGAGKGYLTFALYDHLRNTRGVNVQVTGVEYRADLVGLCNGIAQRSGFDGLSFMQGSIDSFDAAGTDVLIALHACDTATDDAIAKGIAAEAALIVVAPCCHKQIRREMEISRSQNDVAFLLRHGIFMERQAEMVTDGIRALILEYCGYAVKVFEFISDSHTPKNVLIVGTRKSGAARDPAILKRISAAKEFFGIEKHYLEKKAGI